MYTTIVLVVIAAVIVLRKNATVKVLDLGAGDGSALFCDHAVYYIYKSWKYAGSI